MNIEKRQPMSHEFAMIDLGSNSFHLIVARMVNGAIQILSRIKRDVRLAEGLDENGVLSLDAMERGVACLYLFALRLQGFSAENVRVIGTYTLRQAVNAELFLTKARQVFPFPIEIIRGEEEARLIYAGVSHTQPEKARKLVIDIGGGSTEIALGDDFTLLRADSLPMGCVSFAKRFFSQNAFTQANFEQAYQMALTHIEQLAPHYRTLGWQHVLGSSGTINSVSRVLKANGYSDGVITESRLYALVKRGLDTHSFRGLVENRADLLIPGIAILLALFRVLQIQSMRYVDSALREGVMYGMANGFQAQNIRKRTADALTAQFNLDQAQAERVQKTAFCLFDQIRNWKNYAQRLELRTLLGWASQLHELGICINYQGAHRHGAYLLAHLSLPGFDNEQQSLLATLVRLQVKAFKRNDIRSISRFQHRDLLTLVRIFRLAVLLNRAREAASPLTKLRLQVDKSGWTLQFDTGFLAQNPLVLADLTEECELLTNNGFSLQVV